MSFQAPLCIGKTLLFPQQLSSVSFMKQGLLINSALGILQLEGENLRHCVIDLLNGLCTDIQPVPKAALLPLQWQVHSITTVKRMPLAGAAAIELFEGIVPEGWLLFEKNDGWHFWPIRSLLAIGQTRTALLFVYDSVTAEVQAPLSLLEAEFDRWVTGGITACHYTERNFSDYSNLLLVERFAATSIRLRQCDPQQGLKGKDIKQWLPLSSQLAEPDTYAAILSLLAVVVVLRMKRRS